MKAVIIDDEVQSVKSISYILREYCKNIEVIGTANSALEAINLIDKKKPELVFLDIELSDGTGFDVLERLENRNFSVIFITAFDEYAIKAFKYSAVDYILKPIDIDELQKAVERISKQELVTQPLNYDVLLQNIKKSKPNKLTLPTTNGYLFVNIENITHLESDRNYTFIYTTEKKKILVSKNLGEFEDLLDQDIFVRCHRSYLVNLNHIMQYIKSDGGEIEMITGQRIPISRRKKDEFLTKMGQSD